MRAVGRAAAWFAVFYLMWGAAALVWTVMLVVGWLRRDGVVLDDCFLRHVARRRTLPARIDPRAVRRVVALVDGITRRARGVASDMDAWRILGLCSVFWLLQQSWRLPVFLLLVLASPVLTLLLALGASFSYRHLHPWYGRPRNVLIFGFTLHRLGCTPREFLELRLHERDRRRRADDVATGLMWLFDVSLPCALRQDLTHFQDKGSFDPWARRLGAAVAPLVARFSAGGSEPPEPALPPRDLFSKQNRSSWGSDAELWRFAEGVYRGRGTEYSGQALLAELRRRTRVDRGPVVGAPDDPIELILQERVLPHPVLGALSSALPTCRIITLKTPHGPARPSLAMLRGSTDRSAVVDNFNARHPGGFVCAIDLDTVCTTRPVCRPRSAGTSRSRWRAPCCSKPTSPRITWRSRR